MKFESNNRSSGSIDGDWIGIAILLMIPYVRIIGVFMLLKKARRMFGLSDRLMRWVYLLAILVLCGSVGEIFGSLLKFVLPVSGAVALFLDPATHTYVDEFGTSNFLAITRDGKYVTTLSDSILPSITNNSLMTIAADLGMPTERRRVKANELPDFAEVAACGTAVVLTPVGRILDGGNIIDYHLDTIGPVLKKLYDEMTGIQHGERPDKHNWLVEI